MDDGMMHLKGSLRVSLPITVRGIFCRQRRARLRCSSAISSNIVAAGLRACRIEPLIDVRLMPRKQRRGQSGEIPESASRYSSRNVPKPKRSSLRWKNRQFSFKEGSHS